MTNLPVFAKTSLLKTISCTSLDEGNIAGIGLMFYLRFLYYTILNNLGQEIRHSAAELSAEFVRFKSSSCSVVLVNCFNFKYGLSLYTMVNQKEVSTEKVFLLFQCPKTVLWFVLITRLCIVFPLTDCVFSSHLYYPTRSFKPHTPLYIL